MTVGASLRILAQLPPLASNLQLTFEERVRAQEAIERIYEKHRIGTRRPFEERVPRDTLEKKVREYLSRSVALEDLFWRAFGENSVTRVNSYLLAREASSQAVPTDSSKSDP